MHGVAGASGGGRTMRRRDDEGPPVSKQNSPTKVVQHGRAGHRKSSANMKRDSCPAQNQPVGGALQGPKTMKQDPEELDI